MFRIAKSKRNAYGCSLFTSFNLSLCSKLFIIENLGKIERKKFLKQFFDLWFMDSGGWGQGREAGCVLGTRKLLNLYVNSFSFFFWCVCFYPHWGESFIVFSSPPILKWVHDAFPKVIHHCLKLEINLYPLYLL